MEYFLSVVKSGEEPKWPRPAEDLIVGHQDLGSDYVQYWAYLKDSGKAVTDVPSAETLAQENNVSYPVLLIGKGEHEETSSASYLELVLVKNGHAWGKTESSLDNLEDNIASILDVARTSFDMRVEHFITTPQVPPEVEKKLDQIEEGEDNKEVEEEAPKETIAPVVSSGVGGTFKNYPLGVKKSSSSKKWVIIPLIVILVAFGITLLWRGQAFSRFSKPTPTPTPTPVLTPTPTPTPSVERSQFKVRVLNGTITTGAAGALLEVLKTKGWEALTSGNATNSAVLQTEVRARVSVPDAAIQVIISDLAPDLLAASSSSSLKITDKADLEVVIGKK